MRRWNGIEKGFFAAFLFWSAAGLIFTVLQISPGSVARWPVPGWLGRFVDFCLQTGDPLLILLAFANTHLNTARQWTPAVARRWALVILVSSFCVETVGVRTGFPFGDYLYTNRFGPLLGAVPMTIPFAWHVVVTNALLIVRAVAPHLSRPAEAALAALLCALYDVVLEPFATTVKCYWVWSGGSIPLMNYAAWWVISGLLIRFFAPTAATRFRLDPRPWLVLGLTLLIFLAGRGFYRG